MNEFQAWGHDFVRLSFPNGEMADVLAPPGEVRIGSASGNTVVLKGDGIRPHHATILTDSRGITLMVDDPEAAAYVNARPIKERALLRLGDVVSLQSVNLVLKPDRDDAVRAPPESAFDDGDGSDGGDASSRSGLSMTFTDCRLTTSPSLSSARSLIGRAFT